MISITGFIVSKFYEEEIGQYAIQELNKNIYTPVSVAEVDLTLFRKFPDASIHFKNVFIPSVKGFHTEQFKQQNTDTLLYLDDLFFQFSLKGLFAKKYVVREVHINRGKANLFIDSTGTGNYVFWKKTEQDKDARFILNLENVRITNIFLLQLNKAKETELKGFVNRLLLKGDFQKQEYELSGRLAGRIKRFFINQTGFIHDSEIHSEARLIYSRGTYRLINGMIGWDDLDFDVNGSISKSGPMQMDLTITGENLDAASLLDHIPGSTEHVKDKINLAGIIDLTASITGIVSPSEQPSVESRFSLGQGHIRLIDKDVDIYDVRFDGMYTNGSRNNLSTSSVLLDNISFRYLTSRIGGSLNVEDFKNPAFNCSVKADFYLEHLQNLISLEPFDYLHGNVKTRMNIKGRHKKLFDIKKEDLPGLDLRGTVLLDDVHLKLKKNRLGYNHLSGTIEYDKYLKLSNLSASIAGNNLIISGRVDNVIDRLVRDHTSIWADLEIYSDRVTIDSLIAGIKGEESDEKSVRNKFPDHLYIKSKYWFDELKWSNFSAENVRGDLAYRPGYLRFDSFQFSSMGGHVTGDGFYEQTDLMDYKLRLKSTVHDIDISDLFYSCNNFGQSFIVDKHLKGSLTGTIDFYTQFDQSHRLVKESILTESDVEIRNGELIHFEPMLGLSRFIEVEELEHVAFSTLSNQIFIRNSAVVIPKMDIHSSAFNISGSGIHHFNNNFDYKVVVDLSEILAGKSRHNFDNQQEFGVIRDDGLGRTKLYLSIVGTPEDYDISYDRKNAVKSVKDRMSEEKDELKTILNEEFGLFKNDSADFQDRENVDEPDFILEWDEDEEIPDSSVHEKYNTPAFIIEWDDEDDEKKDSIENKQTKGKRRIH